MKGGKIFMKIGVEETFFPLSSFLGGEEKHWHMCESGFSTFQGPPWERGSRFPHTHSALSTCSIFFFFFSTLQFHPFLKSSKASIRGPINFADECGGGGGCGYGSGGGGGGDGDGDGDGASDVDEKVPEFVAPLQRSLRQL